MKRLFSRWRVGPRPVEPPPSDRAVAPRMSPPLPPLWPTSVGIATYADTERPPIVWFPDAPPPPTRIEVRPEWQGRRWL